MRISDWSADVCSSDLLFAENIKSCTGGRDQALSLLAGPANSELAYESGLSEAGILAGRLAQRRRRALRVEEVVGDLERKAQILGVSHQRRPLGRRGLGAQRPRLAREADQRAGLQALQMRDAIKVERRQLGRDVAHLDAHHATGAR